MSLNNFIVESICILNFCLFLKNYALLYWTNSRLIKFRFSLAISLAGLKVASHLIPEGLIAGTLPESLREKKPTGKRGSAPAPVTPSHVPNPGEFSAEDIDKMEIYLDNALQDHSIGSK